MSAFYSWRTRSAVSTCNMRKSMGWRCDNVLCFYIFDSYEAESVLIEKSQHPRALEHT